MFPTAVQWEADVHETAARKNPGLLEVGFGWMLHAFPFQLSMIVPTGLPEVSKRAPTAVQRETDAHETPVRKPNCGPGFGTCWIFQVVPFHRWARRPADVLPTVVHAEGEVHETPFRKAPWLAEVGFGWMVHLLPFQRWTMVPTELPEPSKATPVAVQAEREAHETPFRLLAAGPIGFGAGTMLHLVPAHRSTSVPLVDCPTAMHAERLGQATPLSWLSAAPIGLRVRCSRHRLPFQCCAIVSGVPEP